MSKIEAIKKELKQAKESSQADHLEAVLYEFVKLHEDMSNDAHKRDAEVGGCIKQLSSQLQDFEKLAETVKNDIRTSIRTEAENTAVYFSKTIGEAAGKQVEPTVRKLNSVVEESENVLSRYQASIGFANWYIIVLSISSSIFASLFIMWLLMPKPTLPLTDIQLRTYELGEEFSEVWKTLPKDKKDWFLNKTKKK